MSWGQFCSLDEPREFTPADPDVLGIQVRLVRTVLSLRRQVAAHRWDAELLAVQGRVLEAVATGRPLDEVLRVLEAGTRELSRAADARQRRDLEETVDRLTAVVTKADGWLRDLERSARLDPLTGLANRGHLMSAGRVALADGGAVLFVDVDRFKEVNDRAGHAAGDQLLVRLADRRRDVVAEVAPRAVVGRLGGDEFAVVLPGVDREMAAAIGERLTAVLVDDTEVGRRHLQVSASVGLAMAGPGDTLEDVLLDADRAMYGAKERGRGRVHVIELEDGLPA